MTWPPPWLEVTDGSAGERHAPPRRQRDGPLEVEAVASGAINRLLSSEELAILDLIEKWGSVDRSARKLAHRGSYTDRVFVSPATVQRVAREHGITLASDPARPPRRKLVFPDAPWERNRIWMWEATHFPTAGRVAYAIVDVVTRYWLGYLLSIEPPSSQVKLLYASALEDQGLEPSLPESRPILVPWPDNATDASSADGGPTRETQVESLFGLLAIEWPELTLPTDPDTLHEELARIRREYNTVRLHSGIGYVTPSDEHQGRGWEIRDAREAGLRLARAERIRQNRRATSSAS